MVWFQRSGLDILFLLRKVSGTNWMVFVGMKGSAIIEQLCVLF